MILSGTEAVRRIEAALGAAYPASFRARVGELVALAKTPDFQREFPATRVLLDVEGAREARERSESHLLPFMVSSDEYPDIYAFEPGAAGSQPRVIVWRIHTAVYDWADFSGFLVWVRERCEASRGG